LLAGRVAVVDRGADRLGQPERVDRSRLVLRKGLRRIQIQRPSGAVGRQDLERRQLKAERLAGRRASRDDRGPLEGGMEGSRLVDVEVFDAERGQGVAYLWVQVRRDRDEL